MAAANLDSIPREVLATHVVPYLSSRDVASLAHVNSALRAKLRHERVYSLWPLFNRMYVEDASFRAQVLSVFPERRLALCSWPDLVDLSAFAGVHTADLREGISPRADTSPLAAVHTLRLGRAPPKLPSVAMQCHVFSVDDALTISDLSPFANAHVVELRNTPSVAGIRPRHVTVRESPLLDDVASLSHAKSVSLYNCASVPPAHVALLRGLVTVVLHNSDLREIPAELGSVHTLDLTDSPNLVDVSKVRRIHTLRLGHCKKLVNVAPLAHVHTLELSSGPSPDPYERNTPSRAVLERDVSALANVHTLLLDRNMYLKGVSALGNSHTLDLSHSWCGAIDFACLGRVHTLRLQGNPDIADVTCLGKVHSLNLAWTKIESVRGLEGVHTLDLTGCGSIEDVSPLAAVHTLYLSRCEGILNVGMLGRLYRLDLAYTRVVDVSALGGVHTLRLSHNRAVRDVSALGRVHRLNMSKTKVSDVSVLRTVHTLKLSECGKLGDLSMLGSVHALDLSDSCVTDVRGLGTVHTLNLARTAVTDVSALGGVVVLDISGCKGVRDVSALAHVSVLNIRGCVSIASKIPLRTVKRLVK